MSVVIGNIQDTCSGHSGRSGVFQVSDFEEQSHVGFDGDTFVVSEGQNLVVVHDGVHRFDPIGIEVTVQNDVFGVGGLLFGVGSHQFGHKSVLPFFGGQHVTVQVSGMDDFGVQIHEFHLLADFLIGLDPHLVGGGLTSAGRAHHEHAMSNLQEFSQLDDLQHEFGFREQFVVDDSLHDTFLEVDISLTFDVDTGEQVSQKSEENIQVSSGNLGDIEISKSSHQQSLFRNVWFGSLEGTGDDQHGLDGTETPVVMFGLGQQVTAQHVQSVELVSEDLGVDEPFSHQHVLANKHQIGEHDRNGSEKHFESFGEFGTPEVPGVHGNEGTAGGVQVHFVSFDDDSGRLLFHTVAHRLELHGAHGEHFGDQSVELIETAPGTTGSQSFEDVTEGLVVHFGRAIEHVARFSQSGRQILGGFGLTSTGGSGRGAPQTQMQSLGGSDVNTIGEGGDDQSGAVTEILVGVPEGSVGDVGLGGTFFFVPDELELGLPLEFVVFAHVFFDESEQDVSGVGIQSDHAHDLLS